MEPPLKRQKKILLGDSSSDAESDNEAGGADISSGDLGFKVNEEYARRFEHNKRREELQHLEDKLGKKSAFGKKPQREQDNDGDEGGSESSSESEDEDDEGVLATEALDSEIAATLNAIRSKDPRVYDSKTTFYHSIDEPGAGNTATTAKQAKPMFLRDYHRENYLSGVNSDREEEAPPKPYAQEQEDLKRSIVREMHAAADEYGERNDAGDAEDGESDEGDEFLVKKPNQEKQSAVATKISEHEVVTADKDPETFLSNFMAARAWVPTDRTNFQPFESDDEEQESRAEAFEEAYNFRFEDPNKINEVLTTHARDTTSKYSVRREEPSGRKKKRQAERERKEEAKAERDAERARLRKLKVEQLEENVAKVKQAAGINSSDIPDEEWARFLDEGWDDAKWEKEMQKRFGEDYYAGDEGPEDEEVADASDAPKKRRLKKPTWDDDIDIKDIVPDFDSGDGAGMGDTAEQPDMEDEGRESEPDSHKRKDHVREKKEKQRQARKERRQIEQVVDQSLDLETALLPGSSKKFSGQFRYREGSPLSFGLTARDILMADDRELNQHAGLKKLASFRDPSKKKRDRKHLGKKARLRQWRQDTFGDESGPPMEQPRATSSKPAEDSAPDNNINHGEANIDIRDGSKKKKRKRGKKH